MIFGQFASVAGCVRSFILAQNVEGKFLNFGQTTKKIRPICYQSFAVQSYKS